MAAQPRRPTNLSLDAARVAEARDMGLNLSQLANAALRKAVQAERDRRWQVDNAALIAAKDAWIGKNGLPLERYRLF